MLSREDVVVQSTFSFVRGVLAANYAMGSDVVMLDSFPYTYENAQINRTMVAAGFNFDDEGKQAEMGSDLMLRNYTLEFWTFGPTLAWARNVANVLKFAVEAQHLLPLLDFAEPGEPAFDTLLVTGASATRQIHPEPEPWQEFVYTVTVKVQDEYFASQAYPIT